jgi:proteasome assembly chaperone (PAC2) family protein
MNTTPLRDPWLIAAWPGMGAVAQLAAGYLAQSIPAHEAREIELAGHMPKPKIVVHNGLIQSEAPLRTLLIEARIPSAPHDLVLVTSGAQASVDEAAYCRELVQRAKELGVTRVYTFAAMAAGTALGAAAQVYAAASSPSILKELVERGVLPLADGEIGGLNGYFLKIAKEEGLDGACLLGEMPFFATGIENPRAAAAILRVFAPLAGIPLELTVLEERALAIEAEILRQNPELAPRQAESAGAELPEPVDRDALTKEDLERIEQLFAAARADRKRAVALKAELDRMGVFSRFEDRFLDLFKQAG